MGKPGGLKAGDVTGRVYCAVFLGMVTKIHQVEMWQTMVEADVGNGASLKVRKKDDDYSFRSCVFCCVAVALS